MSPVVSVEEYRKVLNDNSSNDEQILRRLAYIEALCRNIARAELEAYVKSKVANRTERANQSV